MNANARRVYDVFHARSQRSFNRRAMLPLAPCANGQCAYQKHLFRARKRARQRVRLVEISLPNPGSAGGNRRNDGGTARNKDQLGGGNSSQKSFAYLAAKAS